ncbi:heavy metal translocating P-type ATPase [Mastigocoleus testarum]|uniref:Cadmium-transporting ATPase n=1 Tax=Mastigocoleus testarum BC008 TaxID=371196 RepID=A0A0V7ZD32_9CYAN|nr:cation-translocating P-type ATPase [Mastigocoleus testarum]KST62426.1 cadmium-transporting ATPase [Mastigocoleus testarum BC008]
MQKFFQLQTLQARINGMDCPSCAKTIQSNLEQLTGVNEVKVNFGSAQLSVSYDSQGITQKDIFHRVESLGYQIQSVMTQGEMTQTEINQVTKQTASSQTNSQLPQKSKPQKSSIWQFWLTTRRGQRVILSGLGLVLGLVAHSLGLSVWVERAFYGLGMVVVGFPIARAGWFALLSQEADMNLLMTISATGACILGDWLEGAMVVFLFSLGTTLQTFTFGRTRNAIQDLMDLTPSVATVKRDGEENTVPIVNIEVGEIITVRPGQRIPLDGIVVSGISAIDQAPITGESIPVDKGPEETVFAGTFNQTGYLEIKTTRQANETTMARIIHLVESAQGSRAKTQKWVDKFASVYTPAVIIVAALIAFIPPLLFAQSLQTWIYRALVLLVIACPCALVISTPVSIVSAIGAATRKGVLFKGGMSLEAAGKMNILAFDKTGTLTEGLPKVIDIYSLEQSNSNSIVNNPVLNHSVLNIAASLEQNSEHPLAKAILSEAKVKKLILQQPQDFIAIPGKGIQGKLNLKTSCSCHHDSNPVTYLVGNRRLFSELSPQVESKLKEIAQLGQTPILVGTKQNLLGIIALADGLRLESREAVRLLKETGLKEIVMLTGDIEPVAREMAQQVEISQYKAELLPEDKLTQVKQLQERGMVGMVGDGINDAPALASANVSFAIGRTDIALETADVVLVSDDLRRLAYAVTLSRQTVSVMQQNIVFSLVTKGLFLLLGSFGVVGLAVAVLADTGSSLLVTLNGMRLFKV